VARRPRRTWVPHQHQQQQHHHDGHDARRPLGGGWCRGPLVRYLARYVASGCASDKAKEQRAGSFAEERNSRKVARCCAGVFIRFFARSLRTLLSSLNNNQQQINRSITHQARTHTHKRNNVLLVDWFTFLLFQSKWWWLRHQHQHHAECRCFCRLVVVVVWRRACEWRRSVLVRLVGRVQEAAAGRGSDARVVRSRGGGIGLARLVPHTALACLLASVTICSSS